jgi:5'-deoxynucleotidase YfbR-like HD superfamily hydrolase
MTAWAVASCATSAGADVDYERLFKLCLIHDLGEVFGGDISMPYAKLNPEAKQLATEFEAANNRYLSQYFGDSKDEFLALSKEIHEPKSIEAVLMKIADYMEVQQFNSYKHLSAAEATTFMQQKIQGKIDLIDDVTVRKALENFVGSWIDSLSDTRIFPYTK